MRSSVGRRIHGDNIVNMVIVENEFPGVLIFTRYFNRVPEIYLILTSNAIDATCYIQQAFDESIFHSQVHPNTTSPNPSSPNKPLFHPSQHILLSPLPHPPPSALPP